MSEVNVPLLRKVVEWAEAEAKKPGLESQWDQSMWRRTPEQRMNVLAREQAHAELAHTRPVFAVPGSMTMEEHEAAGSAYRTWVASINARTNEITKKMVQTMECGTAFCIAGYVGELEGFWWDGNSTDIDDFARDKLGISRVDASLLFAASNSIEDVREYAEEIAKEKL